MDSEYFEICNWLSRSGSFQGVEDEIIHLAGRLSGSEVIAFYEYLRDNSGRWESEWRSDFQTLFAISGDLLPEVDKAEYWSSNLHRIIESGTMEDLDKFLNEIGLLGWKFEAEKDFPEMPFDIYPIDDPDEFEEAPIAKALRLEKAAIFHRLTDIKETIEQKYREDWVQKFGEKETKER